MLIKWNGLGCWAIGDPANKTANVKVLIPGVNRLDDAFWDRVKNNPDVIQKLKPDSDGKVMAQIVVEASTPKKEAEKAGLAVDLAAMNANEAAAVVKQCLSKDLLESWAESDSRPKVQAAITKQLKLLVVEKSSAKDKDEDEEESEE